MEARVVHVERREGPGIAGGQRPAVIEQGSGRVFPEAEARDDVQELDTGHHTELRPLR